MNRWFVGGLLNAGIFFGGGVFVAGGLGPGSAEFISGFRHRLPGNGEEVFNG